MIAADDIVRTRAEAGAREPLLVVDPLFSESLGHPAGLSDRLELAWLVSSLATVGGALGAGLETDEAVREAAYTYRPGGDATEPAEVQPAD